MNKDDFGYIPAPINVVVKPSEANKDKYSDYESKANAYTEAAALAKTAQFKYDKNTNTIKIVGSKEAKSHPIVEQAKNAIKESFNGAYLGNEENLEAFTQALDQINEQIKANTVYEEYQDFLDKSGFSDDAYRNYVSAYNNFKDSTNLLKSKDLIKGYDKDGKLVSKTPAEWIEYWKNEYNDNDRAKLWVEAGLKLNRTQNDDDLYGAIPYLLMGSTDTSNHVAGFFKFLTSVPRLLPGGKDFSPEEIAEESRVTVPVYGFEDVSELGALFGSAWDEFASVVPERARGMVVSPYDQYLTNRIPFFGGKVNEFSEILESWGVEGKDVPRMSDEDFKKYYDTYVSNPSIFDGEGKIKEEIVEKYGNDGAIKLAILANIVMPREATPSDEYREQAAKDSYSQFIEDVDTWENEGNPVADWANKWNQEINDRLTGRSVYAPNATSAGVAVGSIARIAAEQAALSLISGGALSASNIANTLAREGWGIAGEALDVIGLGQRVASKTPALASAIAALASGSAEGLRGAAKVLYGIGKVAEFATREVGEDAIRGITDDLVMGASLDSQGNLDPDRFMENVWMNAVFAGLGKGVRATFSGLAALADQTRNITGTSISGSQKAQLNLLERALNDSDPTTKLKGFDSEGHPVVWQKGKVKTLGDLVMSSQNIENLKEVTDFIDATPTATKAIEELAQERTIPRELGEKIAVLSKNEDGTMKKPQEIRKVLRENLTDDEIRQAFPDGKIRVGDTTVQILPKKMLAMDLKKLDGADIKSIDGARYRARNLKRTSDMGSVVNTLNGLLVHAKGFAESFRDAVINFANEKNVSVEETMLALRTLRDSGEEVIPGIRKLWDENWKPVSDDLMSMQKKLTGIKTSQKVGYFRDMIRGAYQPDDSDWTLNHDAIVDVLGTDSDFDITASSTAHNTGKLSERVGTKGLELDPYVLAHEFVTSRAQTVFENSEAGLVYSTMQSAAEAGEYWFSEQDALDAIGSEKRVATDVSESPAVKEAKANAEYTITVKTPDGAVGPLSEEASGEMQFFQKAWREAYQEEFDAHKAAYDKYLNEQEDYNDAAMKYAQDKNMKELDGKSVAEKASLNSGKMTVDALKEYYNSHPAPEIPEELLKLPGFTTTLAARMSIVDSAPKEKFEVMNHLTDFHGQLKQLRENGYKKLSPDVKELVDEADKNFTQKTTADIVVYRGEPKSEYNESFKKGDKIDSSAYTFVSPSESYAGLYGEKGGADTVLYRYRLKAGQNIYRAIDASGSGSIEMILPRDINAKITGVEHVKNPETGKPTTIIDVEVKPGSGVHPGEPRAWGSNNPLVWSIEAQAKVVKEEAAQTQTKFNEDATKSNAAEQISKGSKYKRVGNQVNAGKVAGVNGLPHNPFRGISNWVNDNFIKANSIRVKGVGFDTTAYNGGYKMFAESGTFARQVIISMKNGSDLYDAVYNVIRNNGFFVEPTEYMVKTYGALTVDEQAAQVTQRIVNKVMNNKLTDVALNNGAVGNTDALGGILNNQFRRQGIYDFTKFLKKTNWDSVPKDQQKWLNQQMYKMTASVNKDLESKWVKGIQKAMKGLMKLRYKSNMYFNFKNAQLQLTEIQRLYTMNRLGDFATTIKRLATDKDFRQSVSDAAYIYAGDSFGYGLSKSAVGVDSMEESVNAYLKMAEKTTFSKNGMITDLRDLVKNGTSTIDDAALGSIQSAEYTKNFILLAGIMASAEKAGLEGATKDTYIRNRFNTEALAGNEVGRIGLTDSTIGQFSLMYMSFPIRDLTLGVHTLFGGGLSGTPLGAFNYLIKTLGAKGAVWAVEAPWGYSLLDVLGIDVLGIADQYDETPERDYEDMPIGWSIADWNAVNNPFFHGAMTSMVADMYLTYRNSYENARSDWYYDHNGDMNGFEWSPSEASKEALKGVLEGLAPGETAASRAEGQFSDLDRGYRISASGNKLYQTNTDPWNSVWGFFAGSGNTRNAQQYFQTGNPIRGLQENGLRGLGQQLEREFPLDARALAQGRIEARDFREFDSIDQDSYADWFDGSYADEQNWLTGYYEFKDEAQAIKDKYDQLASTADPVRNLAARENELADLRKRVEKYVQAYVAKHPEGISERKMRNVINIFNLGTTGTQSAFTNNIDPSAYNAEYSAAANRVAMGNFPAAYGFSGPTKDEPEAEYEYYYNPALYNALSEGKYGIQADVPLAIRQAADAPIDTPNGRKSLKEYREDVYRLLEVEWDKDEPDYDRINELQKQYIDVFDSIARPIFETYGGRILDTSKSSDTIQEFEKLLNGMVPSDDYRIDKKGKTIYQSTPYMSVDIKKWLNKNYGDYKGYPNTTNKATEKRITEIRNALDKGKTQLAKAKARAVINDIGVGRASADREQIEYLQRILND